MTSTTQILDMKEVDSVLQGLEAMPQFKTITTSNVFKLVEECTQQISNIPALNTTQERVAAVIGIVSAMLKTRYGVQIPAPLQTFLDHFIVDAIEMASKNPTIQKAEKEVTTCCGRC